jgi:hypothetical protein
LSFGFLHNLHIRFSILNRTGVLLNMSDIFEAHGRVYKIDKGNVVVKDISRKRIAEFPYEKHLLAGDLLDVICPIRRAERHPMNENMLSRYGEGVDSTWDYILMSVPAVERVE